MIKELEDLKKAVTLLQKKNYFPARELLLKLSKKWPNHPDVWQLLGSAERHCGNLPQSQKAFEKSLQINPNQPQVLNNYGNLLASENKLYDALSKYQRALQLAPNNMDALYNAAITHLKLGQPDHAINILNQLNSISPHTSKVICGLADAYIAKNDDTRAIELLESEIQHFEDELILFKLGLAYKKKQRWQSALSYFEKSSNLSRNNPSILHQIASVEGALGNFESAIQHFKQCIEIEPQNPSHHYWLNSLLWTINSPEFLNSYKNIYKKLPENTELILDYSRLLKLSGNKAESLKVLQNKSKEKPSSLDEALLKANLLRGALKPEESLKILNRAQIAYPRHPGVNEETAKTLIQLNRPDDALSVLDETLESHPLNQSLLCLKATALKLLESPKYFELINYKSLVKFYTIECPAGFTSLKEFLREVQNCVLSLHKTQNAPIEQSLVNGTQSFDNLFSCEAPVIGLLQEQISKKINEYIADLPHDSKHPVFSRNTGNFAFTDSWSVRLFNNGHHKSHYHSEGWLSSVFYVDIPDEVNQKGQGWLEFGRSDDEIFGDDQADFCVKPERGLLVLFPSFLWHGTRPFESDQQRITVAFDLIPK